MFKCLGPAHIGLQLPWPEVHDLDARGVRAGGFKRLLPGASGVIDARAFLTVLDEIGFDGPTLVEPFNAEVRALPPDGRVAAVAASLESVWP
jgi:sugar phosphate isomerase/epimerase